MDLRPPRPAAPVLDLDVLWMLSPAALDFAASTISLVEGRVPDDYLDAALLLVEELVAEGGTLEMIDGAGLARAVHRIMLEPDFSDEGL